MDAPVSFTMVLVPYVTTAVVSITLCYLVLVPALLSPLARIPSAHWSAAISPLWILYIRRGGRENATLLAAHRRLGPVVRVGPSDVSIDSIDYLKMVYGNFDKPLWYSVFDNYGTSPADRSVPCLFSMGSGRTHAQRKRMLAHVYAKSTLQTSAVLASHTGTLVWDRLRPCLAGTGDGVDVFPLFLAVSMDAIAAHVFGGTEGAFSTTTATSASSSSTAGTDFIRRKAYRNHWLQLYLSRHGAPFFPQELPRLTWFLRRVCSLSPYPRWVDWANAELRAWNETLCARAMAAAAMDDYSSPVLRALWAGLQREADDDKKHPVAIQSELLDHVLAGHETTGIVLTYLAWQLSRSPAIQHALQAELAAHEDVSQGKATPATLDALPLLHAVVLETLRLHAPIPGPQPRVTPSSGCHLGHYALPGGVRIAAAAYTLHRDAHLFPDPERWDPERWLPGKTQPAGERQARIRQLWAFSSGGRMCLGSHFATQEMKAVTAMIYSSFTTHVVDDTGMEQADSYTARPTSERLYLRFEPLRRVRL